MPGWRGRGQASDATHSRVAVAVLSGLCPDGPELRGSAAGRDLCAGDASGGVEGVEGGVDLAGGLVVMEGLADLAAGQPFGVLLEGGVDLFGERVAGRAGQRPRGGSGGVVVQCERCGEVRGADLGLAVGEGVEQREPDDVRLGAGGDLRDDPVGRLGGELAVGVMPQLTRVGIETDLSGLACLPERGGEEALQAGGGERVGIAAVGQQSLAAARNQQDAVDVAVGELEGGGVAAQLVLGDVPDDRDVRGAGARRRGAGQDREWPAVPAGAQGR